MRDRINEYAKVLGLDPVWYTFDGGRTLIIRRPEGALVWRGSYNWGEEDRFELRVMDFLDTLPWPREDDPRVEGEY